MANGFASTSQKADGGPIESHFRTANVGPAVDEKLKEFAAGDMAKKITQIKTILESFPGSHVLGPLATRAKAAETVALDRQRTVDKSSASPARSRSEHVGAKACEHELDEASHLWRHLPVRQIDKMQRRPREVIFREQPHDAACLHFRSREIVR